MTFIEVKDLTFAYGTRAILDGISLSVSEPGLMCILGPNGVGKTTLVKCIDNLLSYQSGSILLDGEEVRDMASADVARKIAFVPNNAFSTFSITVTEAVMMGRYPVSGWNTTDEDLAIVEDAISIMGLGELADRDIRELSAGQRQRVMIARGIVQQPEVLILDEPTSNLDVKYQMEVMSFLKRLAQARNLIVLAVCHDLNITAAYADRIALMSGGRVFADGSAASVLTPENIRSAYGIDCSVTVSDGIPHIALLPPKETAAVSLRSASGSSKSFPDIRRRDRRFAFVFIVVAILLGSAVVVYNIDDDDDGSLLGHTVTGDEVPSEDSRLWVYGNANQDDRIDSDDVTYLTGVVGGTLPYTPLCDANLDGKVNDSDIDYLKDIIKIAETHSGSIDVFYIDDYRQNQKVSWPVESIAIGYVTTAYMALITGVSSKVVAVDSTISTYWNELSTYFDTTVYGAVELAGSSYELIIDSGADVYITGYFCKTIDPVTRDRLGGFGIDTMVLTTADNDGIKNDYIDRSTVMFGYLLQGDMDRTYEYLEWHDDVVKSVTDNAATIASADMEAFMEVHVTTADFDGSYKVTGKDQVNNIHARDAGAKAVGQTSAYLSSNYNVIGRERIYTVMSEEAVGDSIWFVYNCQDGFRQSVTLSEVMSKDEFPDAPVSIIHYLGLAREAGSTGMYVVEMAFYQSAMYHMDQTIGGVTMTYEDLFDYFINHFLSDGTVTLSPQITHFFKT